MTIYAHNHQPGEPCVFKDCPVATRFLRGWTPGEDTMVWPPPPGTVEAAAPYQQPADLGPPERHRLATFDEVEDAGLDGTLCEADELALVLVLTGQEVRILAILVQSDIWAEAGDPYRTRDEDRHTLHDVLQAAAKAVTR